MVVVYLSIPTSNHNTETGMTFGGAVVYLSIPTSNHNHQVRHVTVNKLFIYLFLHQTTTGKYKDYFQIVLFIYLFLHQTTTYCLCSFSYAVLFIYLFLHQTTTLHRETIVFHSCLSIYSYIKPQLL